MGVGLTLPSPTISDSDPDVGREEEVLSIEGVLTRGVNDDTSTVKTFRTKKVGTEVEEITRRTGLRHEGG